MITALDQPLIDALRQYRVRYCCEDCAHFETASLDCSLGYLTEVHRYRDLEPGRTITFCKTFELG